MRADDPLSSGIGEVRTFSSDAIVGLLQKFPRELDAVEYLGELQVICCRWASGKWRFGGEIEWRNSGDVARGLATGDREIEFCPSRAIFSPGANPSAIISGQSAAGDRA